MQNMTLSLFAQGSEVEYDRLRQEIDRCGQNGHSYEFHQCLLLPGCFPPVATVGFWRDTGGYVMYIPTEVNYRGENQTARRFFQSGRQGFGTFEELRTFLFAMTGAAPAAAPLRTSPAAAPPKPAAPVPRMAPLTEADKVTLPRRTAPPPDYHTLAQALGAVVLGQEEAVELVAFKLYTHICKKQPARPLSLIFYGPTGVGKSELGKHVAQVLDGGSGAGTWQFVWTELNTFTEAHSAYRLIGAPPGYVGYEDKPVFEAVAQNPKTVFMFDELEKAHPEVIKTFMSVLDEGRCAARKEQPGHGRELDFRQCIFLFTTNADLSGSFPAGRVGFSALPPEKPSYHDVPTGEETVSIANRVFAANERGRRAIAAGGCLREIAGRFGGFVEFKPLEDLARVNIIARQIAQLGAEYGLHVTYVSPTVVQAVVDRTAVEEVFSVRSHMSVIEGYLTPLFLENAPRFQGCPVRLEGDMENMRLVGART